MCSYPFRSIHYGSAKYAVDLEKKWHLTPPYVSIYLVKLPGLLGVSARIRPNHIYVSICTDIHMETCIVPNATGSGDAHSLKMPNVSGSGAPH